MRRTLALTVTLTVTLLACLTAACAAKDDKPRTDHLNVDRPPAIADMPRMATVSGKSLPLEAFQVGDRAKSTISLARQLLIADCMKRFGYAFPLTQNSPPGAAALLARRYGIADADAAAKWGYGGPPDAAPIKAKPQRSLDPNQALVLTGWPDGQGKPGMTPPTGQTVGGLQIPPGGCAGQAGRRLSGDDSGMLGDDPLVRDIDASAYSKAESDSRVTEMQAKWSSCMKEKGYDFPHSLAVVDSLTRTESQAPPAEIQLALADVECKGATNYIGVWFTVESAYQNALIEKNFQALTTVKQRIDRTVSNASSVVAAG